MIYNFFREQPKKLSQTFEPTLFNLADFVKKQVEVRFSAEPTSHDGGLLLLNEVEKQIGLVDKLAKCINDPRHQAYVHHPIDSMLKQRVMQIAAGYEDANDCNSLKNDGILKICSGQQHSLATQSAMCRLENFPGPKELYNMARAFVDNFITSYPKAPGLIIFDCDDTSALIYGQQELAFYNTYYGDHCYMPLHIYEGLCLYILIILYKSNKK